MKTLRTAALVVGAVALIATGVGAVGALAAGTTISAAMAATTVAGLSLATIATVASVASAALSLAAGLAYKRPPLSGSQTTFNSDPGAPIPYAIGRTSNAGNIVYWDTNDTNDKGDNDRQTFVVILSGAGPVEEIEGFYSDRVEVPFTTDGAALGFYNTFMWQKTQLGLTPEPAALSIPADPLTPPGWTSAHKLSGYAAAMWRMRFDTKGKKFTNGTPKPSWVGKWVKVYDPRLDSTYPGGVGACRALDETTYVWSQCPYLHGLTWCLGRWQNGKRVLGIGAPIEGIDIDSFVQGANISDLNGWKIGGVVYSTDNKWDVLVSMLQAGCGEPMALGAKISCFVNAPKVSLDTISISDLSGAVSVQATQARRDRLNGIVPRYRSEEHGWEVVSAAPVIVPEHVAFDGGERTKEADYQLVQDVDQAATLARYAIENSREFGPITVPLRPRWIGYKPGDAVTITIPEVGLNSQKVVFSNRDIDPASGCPRFTARSETDGKHPFALGETTTPPPTPGVTGPPVNPVASGGAWNIVGTSVAVENTKLPAIVIEGSIDSTSTDAIVFEFRETDGDPGPDVGWIAAGIEPPTTTRKIILGVKPGIEYEAAVSYRRQGVIGERLVLGPVTISQLQVEVGTNIVGPDGSLLFPSELLNTAINLDPDGRLTVAIDGLETLLGEVTIGGLGGVTNGAFTSFQSSVNGSLSSINSTLVTQASTNSAVAASITSLTTSIGGVSASLTTEQAVRSAADTALAGQITTLTSSVNGSLATINSTLVTQASTNSAVAGQISTLNTTVGGHTATLTTYGSSINGLQLRYGVKLDVNGYVTGWVANNNGTTGDMLILADRFAIGDPSTPTNVPFEVVSGVTYMKTAVIRDLTVGTIKLAGNAVTKRQFTQMSGTRSGTGSGSWQTVASTTVSLAFAADVILQASGQHAYFSGTQPWQWRFLANGGQVQLRGGDGGITDLPCMNGSHSASAGSNTYELQWWATNSNLQLTSANMIVDPAMK